MSEIQDQQITKFEGDPFELATIVASRIELETVLLLDSQTWRNPRLDLPDESPILEFGIDETAHGKDVGNSKIYVKIGFVSHDSQVEDVEKSIYRVKATFILIYRIASFEAIEQRNLEAFSVTTGIYNAWPYWREFLQNTTIRMGLPAVVAPPFRFEPKDN